MVCFSVHRLPSVQPVLNSRVAYLLRHLWAMPWCLHRWPLIHLMVSGYTVARATVFPVLLRGDLGHCSVSGQCNGCCTDAHRLCRRRRIGSIGAHVLTSFKIIQLGQLYSGVLHRCPVLVHIGSSGASRVYGPAHLVSLILPQAPRALSSSPN